jgi:phage/plasmid primase-like uncharacterized protein
MTTFSAQDIASRLGLKRYPRSWRGKCPSCSYGGNIFSIRNKVGSRVRLYCANGCTIEELNYAIGQLIGGWKPTPVENYNPTAFAEAHSRKTEAALRLWSGSELYGHEKYLAARGLAALKSDALRFRGDCHHPEGGALAAMVALVRDVAGEPVAIQRTFLRRDRSFKADIRPDKASLGPIWGSAVRLAPAIILNGETDVASVPPQLVIGEGIETSASAGLLLGLPAWAALSAGNLGKGLVLPAGIRSIVIAADCDKRDQNGKLPGQDAARNAAARWRAMGINVQIVIPNSIGDFNDVLMASTHG